MPKPCAICVHASRPAIERDIRATASPTEVARRWEHVTREAVRMHRDRDMPAQDSIGVEADVSTLDRVEDLAGRLEEKLLHAGAPTAYAQLAGQLRQSLELVARLRRELDERPQVAILIAPEWLQVRSVILHALAPFPEARGAVAEALSALQTQPRALPSP